MSFFWRFTGMGEERLNFFSAFILCMLVLLPEQTLASAGGSLERHSSNVFALIDQVPYSAKRHVSVRYGANLKEVNSGPIAVEKTVVTPYSETVVLGGEKIETQVAADSFAISFSAETDVPQSFAVLLVMEDSVPKALLHNYSEDQLLALSTRTKLALSRVDPLLTDEQVKNVSFDLLGADDGGLVFSASISETDITNLKSVYLVFERPNLEAVSIVFAGFRSDSPPEDVIVLHSQKPGMSGVQPALLVTDSNANRYSVEADENGTYVFPRPTTGVFSLTFSTEVDVFYMPYGRWFARDQKLNGYEMLFTPEYVNDGGGVSDLRAWQASIRTSDIVSEFSSSTSPHVRAWWAGSANKRIRFRGDYFQNNLGFHDRDVDMSLESECLRGVYFAESDVQAIQVRLFEKSHILAAEEIALSEQKCTYIHAIAPGHTLQSYVHINKIVSEIAPDFLLFAANPSTFMYLTPAFQEAYFGYGSGHSPVASFDLDGQENLKFVPPATDWFAHTTKPSFAFENGVVVSAAYGLALEHAPPEAVKGWKTLNKIVDRYQSDFPGVLIVLDTLYEVARCAAQGDCGSVPVKSIDNVVVQGGVPQFFANISSVCEGTGVVCTALRPEPQLSTPVARALIYENDFHLNRHGHYWLGNRLAQSIIEHLRSAQKD